MKTKPIGLKNKELQTNENKKPSKRKRTADTEPVNRLNVEQKGPSKKQQKIIVYKDLEDLRNDESITFKNEKLVGDRSEDQKEDEVLNTSIGSTDTIDSFENYLANVGVGPHPGLNDSAILEFERNFAKNETVTPQTEETKLQRLQKENELLQRLVNPIVTQFQAASLGFFGRSYLHYKLKFNDISPKLEKMQELNMLQEIKEAFANGDYSKAWDTINEAEDLIKQVETHQHQNAEKTFEM